jgi:hypothetical protein
LQQTHQNTNKTPPVSKQYQHKNNKTPAISKLVQNPQKLLQLAKCHNNKTTTYQKQEPQELNNNISKTRTTRTLTTLAESSTTLITKQGTSSSIQTFFITKPQIVYNYTQKPYSVNSKNSIQFLRIINLQAKTT